VKGKLRDAAGTLNKMFADCMQVQASTFGPWNCTDARDCSDGPTASWLKKLGQTDQLAQLCSGSPLPTLTSRAFVKVST